MRSLENESTTTANVIYILFLLGLITVVTPVIGVIIAYVNRSDSSTWLESHYHFQIRTFWIGILYLFIGVLLSKVVIGLFVLFYLFVWLIVRCAKGLKFLGNKNAYPNPTGWFF